MITIITENWTFFYHIKLL